MLFPSNYVPPQSLFRNQNRSYGYLIVKRGKGRTEPFLGCTNYKADKTGCPGWMTKDYYEKNVKNKEF